MLSPEEAYKYDNTFRHIVDIMRAELSVYRITPAELRQAALLAATMHEMERVRPLFILHDSIDMKVPMDQPAMFGNWADSNTLSRTASGSQHWVFKTPVITPASKNHFFIVPHGDRNYAICSHCDLSDVYANAFNVPCKP